MILELQFVTYIRFVFGHCHVTFPYKQILSLFGHCHVPSPYEEPLSFFGRFVQKVVICFSYSFVQKTTQQSDGNCNAASDFQHLSKLFKKHPSLSANTYEKESEYCIAHHDAKMCFSPNCRYHILLLGNVEELLQKLDSLCFTYQHVDFLYTSCKY